MTENPPASNLCPRCGSLKTEGDPAVPCPACLMKIGLESWAGGQSPSQIANTPTQSSGYQPAPHVEELADRFPQFEILELVGQGGMGAVYKARQRTLDRIVALKIIRPDVEQQAGFAERFSREAKTLARLNHPNIITVHDFGESDGLFYLVMEFVEGSNLRELMHDSIESPVALKIVSAICDALHYAHERDVVHRDIKPENILVDSLGHVKIADFGLAKIVDGSQISSGLTNSRQVMGTWQYMAPEQMQGTKSVDHRADIYSLGVIFYEMLTGEVPFGFFEPPSKKVAIDVRLDEIVLKALAREPERRYQSASDIHSAVANVTSSSLQRAKQAPDANIRPAARGFSTIMERQVSNLWRWMAAPEPATVEKSAQLPVGVMLLLCIIGIGATFLPWLSFAGPQFSSPLVLNGFDITEGSIAIVPFAIAGVLAAASSAAGKSRPWLMAALILSAGSVLMLLFEFNHRASYLTVTQLDGERTNLNRLAFTRSFLPAFFVAIGSAVGLMLLAASSFRHLNFGSLKPESLSDSEDDREAVEEYLVPLIRQDKIGAIRHYRNMTGARLSEAKKAVEEITAKHKIEPVEKEALPTRGAGILLMCWGSYLLLVCVAFLVGGAMMLAGNEREHVTGAWSMVTCVLIFPVALLVLRGAWNLLSRESYSAALWGCFAGLPFGIWGLNVLSRDEVKKLFRAGPASAQNEKTDEPRVSRKAIVGTCWALMVLFFPLAFSPSFSLNNRGNVPWQYPLMFTLGPIGGLAPIGTTVLGLMAISNIRHAKGKLYGLPLAFFDAVLFPTLLANVLLIGILSWGFMLLRIPSGSPGFVWGILFGLPLCLVLDVIVLTKLWKSLSSSVERQHRSNDFFASAE